MSKRTKQLRRPFIEELRKQIVFNIPNLGGLEPHAHEARVLSAIDRWTAGEESNNAFESGVFHVCDEIARRLDEEIS